MAKPVLTYFPIPGRALGIRVCLGAAKIAYDFRAIDYKTLLEEREKSPAAYPLGQVPTLTFPDGRVVVQSGAILRWAGRKAGLYPREAERDDDALTIDELIFTCEDALAKAPQDADPDAKKAKRAEYAAKVLPKFVGFLDARLAAAPGGGPFYLGAALSIADLAVFSLVNGISSGSWDHIPGDYVAARWPRLSAHAAAVAAHPLVVAHGALSA